MSVVVKRFCDKCKKEVLEKDQLWNVEIRAECEERVSQFNYPCKTIQVCRPCLESFGIYVVEKPGVEKPKPSSVEDLVREIIALVQE